MIYANKKVSNTSNSAQQTAQILANVKALLEKNIIRLETDTVYLYPQLWKDRLDAENWIKCLHRYYCIKKQWKSQGTLYFRHMENNELIGSISNNKAKVLLFS